MKSIFARAVIGSPGVVTHSIITTVNVLRSYTRLYLKQQRNPTEKRVIKMVWLQTSRSDIVSH